MKVEITLDKKRYLFFDLNAMCSFQEVTGKNLFEAKVFKRVLTKMEPVDLRALLWACLLDDDPDLTLREAGKLMQDMGKVATAINQAITVALPEAEKSRPLARKSRSG